MNTRNKRHSGFSLIELLIVVAIILVIAAIAVPQMISSLQRSNETSAASNLRQIVTAESHYYQLYGGFAAATKDLGDEGGTVTCGTGTLGATGLGACTLQSSIADNVGTNPISGYSYAYTLGSTITGTNGGTTGLGGSYAITATPTTTFKGAKNYCADSSGTIVYGTATPTIPMTAAGGACPAVSSTVFTVGN